MAHPKPTMNLSIAKSHQLAGQLVGMQLSVANLLALLVSMASVIAGATTLAVQQFPDRAAWPIWLAAAGIGIGLALLIEGLTLSALIRLRVAGRTIAEAEERLRAVREQRLAALAVPDPISPVYPLLKKRFHEMRTLIERDVRHMRKQQTRQARADRRNSRLLACGGSLASMCAGGLFYHAILAGLGPLVSLGLSVVFTLAVTGTFVSSEVFKDLQSQAIRENFANGDLAESAMRQETRLQSLWAVHAQIATYLRSAEAQQAIVEGGKLLVTSILEEVHADLRRQSAHPGQISSPEDQPQSLVAIPAMSRDQGISVRPEPEAVGPTENKAQLVLPWQSHNGHQVQPEPAGSVVSPEVSRSAQALEGLPSEPTPLDRIERAMLHALEQVAPETRAELLHLAQTASLERLTHAVHERFPGYVSLLTRERVAHVMAVAFQRTEQGAGSPGSLSPKESPIRVIGSGLTEGQETRGSSQASEKKDDAARAQKTGSEVRDTLSPARTQAQMSKPNRARRALPDVSPDQSQPSIPEAHAVSGTASNHYQRIKGVMQTMYREGRNLSYQEIALAANVGYSTVKRHAPGIRQELQAISHQE